MRLLVCGGRNFSNYEFLETVLNEYYIKYGNSLVIISGGAKGADSMAEHFADTNNLEKHIIYADWAKYGKKAGHLRNQKMIDEGQPDEAVAMPGGPGTRDMINRCRLAGIKINVYAY